MVLMCVAGEERGVYSTCCVGSPNRNPALRACAHMLNTATAALCNLRTENPVTSPSSLVRMKVKAVVLPSQSLKIKALSHPALFLSWSRWAGFQQGEDRSCGLHPVLEVGGRRRNRWYRNQTAFSRHGGAQWGDC